MGYMEYKKRILFIINPISGVGKQKIVERSIEEFIDKSKFDYEIAYTAYAHHATTLSKEAVNRGIDIVAVVGGDGSVNDCVRGIAGTNVFLAIIPAGSGNGLARTLKIPLNIKDSIEIINATQSICIDTVSLNDTVYVSIAGIGFDALIAKEFLKVKTRGFNAYFQIIAHFYPIYTPQHYILSIDGVKHETTALFICFANSNQFGYNTLIAPSASLTDGYMDVICVKKVPLILLPFIAGLLFTKRFEKSIYVKSYKAKKVHIYNDTSIDLNVDGEHLEITGGIDIKIQPQNLNIII